MRPPTTVYPAIYLKRLYLQVTEKNTHGIHPMGYSKDVLNLRLSAKSTRIVVFLA